MQGIQGRVCETAIERIDKSPGDYRYREPAPMYNVVIARYGIFANYLSLDGT